jgi:PEGA domain
VTSSQVIVMPASKAPWAVAAVALIALGGAGWALSRKMTPPAAPAVAAADSARLTIETSPANAQIFIDDAAVTGNPFTASFPRGQSHTVRVTAPGFAPKAEHIELTDNVKLKISLDAAQAGDAPATPATATGPSGTKVVYLPAKPGAPATAAPPQTAAAAATATAADPKGPLRNVDSSNPYATTGGAGAKPSRGVDSANPYK